jgi:sarcosine oxidase
LKAGLHHAGPVADPDEVGAVDEGVAAWVARWASTRYADTGERLGAETCFYTSTADEGFVLERHGRVVVGSACSGHGFKFAPVVGRTLAALAREAAR